jgi:hypothetical protein
MCSSDMRSAPAASRALVAFASTRPSSPLAAVRHRTERPRTEPAPTSLSPPARSAARARRTEAGPVVRERDVTSFTVTRTARAAHRPSRRSHVQSRRRTCRPWPQTQVGEFIGRQSFLVIAGQDPTDRVWASLLVGGVGFARAVDERHVLIDALFLPGDPLEAALAGPDARIGVLAIECLQTW